MGTIRIKQATKQGYIELELPGLADLSYPDSRTRRGRVIGGKISLTLTASENGICEIEGTMENKNDPHLIGRNGEPATEEELQEFKEHLPKRYRIRKLTPRECFRLMGVSDENASKMLAVNSNTQCYKQAGNSIVVPVLMAIFSQMHIEGVKPWNEMSEDVIYRLIDENK